MGVLGSLSQLGIQSDGSNVNVFRGTISARNIVGDYGDVWYVDSNKSTSGNGKSWARAFATITEAAAAAGDGDIIAMFGSFTEAVTVTEDSLRFIGMGVSPANCVWTGAADAKCLTINGGVGVEVSNVRFRPPAYSAGIPCAVYLQDATYARIIGCRIQGKASSWYGIYTTGVCDNVEIIGNDFLYMNTATYGTAIKSSGAGGDISGAKILNNRFESNLNHIVAPMKQSLIKGNVFPAGGLAAAGTYSTTLTVLALDIHGGATGYNKVTANYFGGLYHQAHLYGGTADEWDGNFCVDRTHATQVDATTGISILAPAA